MNKILIASTNHNKISEISSVLNDIDFVSLAEFSEIPEPDEPYESFVENANYKAKYYGNITGQISLSDDTGLCIKNLNDFPGVRSKELLFRCKTMANTIKTLREMLNNQSSEVSFISAISVYNPHDNSIISVEGHVNGTLKLDDEEISGFGYDPIFIPEGYSQTFTELGIEVKNKISHRAIA